MKKSVLTLLMATAATLAPLLFFSCSGLVSPSAPDSSSAEERYTLSGSFSMPSSDAAPSQLLTPSTNSRNAIPNLSGLIYTVEAVRDSDGQRATTISEDGKTYEFTDLAAGTWQITAYANTGDGTCVMQSETKPITLSKSNPQANTSLDMGIPNGTGSIAIPISWTSGSGIGYCTWEFSGGITDSGNNTNSSFSIAVPSVSTGTYALTLKFYTSAESFANGFTPIYSCTEYVTVYPGLTTNGWTSSTAPHIGTSFSVTNA